MDSSGRTPPSRPNDYHDPSYDNAPSARGARGSLEQQKLDLLGPAYVLEQTSQQQYSRRRIINAEELRASIAQQDSSELDHVHARRLFVIQGLPTEYLQVLRDTLNIDPLFVDAHVSRRGYRPWIRRRRRRDDAAGSKSSACFEYPELLPSHNVLTDLTDATKQTPGHDSDDAVGKPPAHVISADGDVAVFCRASLWLCPKADVLLLDRPVKTQSPSRPDNGPYRSSELSRASTIGVVNELRSDPFHNSNNASGNSQTASFETLLYDNLAEEWREEPDEDALRSLIEDIAIHQWTELFEALSTDLIPGAGEMTALYWQMQKSLEKNLTSSKFYGKSFHASSPSTTSPASASSEWESLLARLTRRAELSRQLISPPSVATVEVPPSQLPTQPPVATVYDPQLNQRNNNSSSSSSSAEKNQHSLDRVSYMGGVLLPLSIVSSILSMSDPFGPGGSMFFVFWAVSIPLVFVTVFVIYADSIRKAEVWIEVAASGGGGSSGPGSDVENPEDLDHDHGHGHDHDHDHEHNGAVPYSATLQLPVVEPKAGRVMGMAAFGEDYHHSRVDDGSFDEPSMMAEKMFGRGSGSRRKWQKQQLGWKGACLTAFQLYKLKKGRPPNWGGNVRRERTN
ncbi:hypothetical protein Hte_003493 [Hypoxylon texense]